MSKWSALSLVALFVCACLAHAQGNGGQARPIRYRAAFLSTNLAANDWKLTVFPSEGEAFSIALPGVFSPFAFTADGKAMYGSAMRNPRLRTLPDPDAQTLSKVEFNPTRVSLVPGSAGLRPIYSVAVSPRADKVLVVSGFKQKLGCGIFELNLSDGALREIVFDINCQPAGVPTNWARLNVSPDGKHATAYRRHILELIDLSSGTIQSLGERFMEAAWSPDGRWLAGLEAKWTGGTILLDPRTLKPSRTLPQSQCEWSPDSRYLLQDNDGTLRTIEVATGRVRTIASSKNKVAEVTTAWVSSEIRP